MVNPLYVVVDLAVCVLAVRSIGLVRHRSPWAAVGWVFAFLYGVAAAVEFSLLPAHRFASQVAYGALLAAAATFIASALRDEPQGQPWWWPRSLTSTRAERRARGGR